MARLLRSLSAASRVGFGHRDRATRISYRLAIVHGLLTRAPKPVISEFVSALNTWTRPRGLPLTLALRSGAAAAF